MTGRVSGRTAIVTGAARGIGRAIADRLAAEGAAVVLADRDAETLASTAAELDAAHGGGVERVDCDVTSPDDAERLAARAVERFGAADILINNAGISHHATFTEISHDDWREVLDVNLTGAFNCAAAVVPRMIDAGHGRIVNVSSMAGRNVSYHGAASYTASKWGLIGLTKHAAWDLGEHGITVNALCPGPTLTAMTTADTTEADRARTAEKTPTGRWASPEDQASAALYLASDEASHVNGTVLEVDGGMWLGPRHEV